MPQGQSAEKPRAVNASRWRRGLSSLLAGGPVSLTIPIALAALAVLLPTFYSGAYWIRELSLIVVLALVVSGVNLSFGYAGELQLGQVFMYAVGAYLTMILAIHGTTDILLLMLIGGVAAVAVGILIAVPAMRIGGWSLAMASFFLVITIPDLAAIFGKWTGGLNGLTGVPIPTLFGRQLGNSGLYEVAVIVAILWFACYRNLVTSRFGVVFRVLRESPVLTQSLGYSPARLKTSVYALGAFPAGVAGCLFGYVSLIVEPTTFGLTLGIGIVAASVLGGTESVYGVFIGAALLQLGPEKSVSFAAYAPVVYGGFLIVAATVLRGGAARLGRVAASRALRWLDPDRTVAESTDAGAHIEGEPYVLDVATGGNGNAGGNGSSPERAALPQVQGKRVSVEGVSKSFGGVAALQDVSLTAEPGEVTGLIGSNGSGKTTLLNVICGYASASDGSVKLGDTAISRLRPARSRGSVSGGRSRPRPCRAGYRLATLLLPGVTRETTSDSWPRFCACPGTGGPSGPTGGRRPSSCNSRASSGSPIRTRRACRWAPGGSSRSPGRCAPGLPSSCWMRPHPVSTTKKWPGWRRWCRRWPTPERPSSSSSTTSSSSPASPGRSTCSTWAS